MKPKSKGRSSNNTDQSLGKHDTASCYDFTKLKEALHLAHSSLINNLAVNDSIAMQNGSPASCVYDFSKVAEALAVMDKEALDALSFSQRRKDFSKSIKKNSDNEEVAVDDLALGQRLGIGRRRIPRTKKNRDDLKVKKAEHKRILEEMKTKRWKDMFLLTLRSLKKCS
ncbi:uncharacterized protein LOC112181747 [Rosa chinensis]|uniref:uncharacterized protein LOC112181747 n=1 Tax=Rosa chinensis TaxID=74649 RepID=UPI000D0963FE|nr:uncharacterized protein LOC112181747 [Rosa chinensis]